jgi:hypothetical protein
MTKLDEIKDLRTDKSESFVATYSQLVEETTSELH